MARFSTSKENDQPRTRPLHGSSAAQVTIIATNTTVEGSIQTASDLRISGHVKGNLDIKGRCVISEEGSIEGEVFAGSATIAGNVTGDLVVTESLCLSSSANVSGSIKTGRLIVEEGAIFNGECQTGKRGQVNSKLLVVPDVRPDVREETEPISSSL